MAGPDFDVREAVDTDILLIEERYLRSWRAAYGGFLDTDVLAVEAEKRRSFDWRRGITAPTSVVLIAVGSTGQVVGVVQADEDLPAPRDLPEITMLYVDPDAWGSPVAAALLRAAETWMASRSHGSARLRVVEEHHRARRFYEREGWSLDPDLEPVRNDFGRLLYYRRSLDE
jgi:GNAT superfamily N-acetyltransferase